MSSYPSESATSAGRYSLTHSLVRAFSIDLRTIALFRVLIGAIIIADLLLRSRDFTAFFTDAGVMPRPSRASVNRRLSQPPNGDYQLDFADFAA